MKTIFVSAPFSKYELGWNLSGSTKIGQDNEIPIVGDLLKTFGTSSDEVEALIARLPSESLGEYKDRFQECKEKGFTTKGVTCLVKLAQDIRKALREPKGGPAPSAQIAPPPSEFPWLPVGIGVVAAGGLVAVLASL